jgi:hypothetical protein
MAGYTKSLTKSKSTGPEKVLVLKNTNWSRHKKQNSYRKSQAGVTKKMHGSGTQKANDSYTKYLTKKQKPRPTQKHKLE